MQYVFGHLLESKLQYYEPERFWKVFKLWGQVVNVREQQDACDFYQALIDQVDEQIKVRTSPTEVLSQKMRKLNRVCCDHSCAVLVCAYMPSLSPSRRPVVCVGFCLVPSRVNDAELPCSRIVVISRVVKKTGILFHVCRNWAKKKCSRRSSKGCSRTRRSAKTARTGTI